LPLDAGVPLQDVLLEGVHQMNLVAQRREVLGLGLGRALGRVVAGGYGLGVRVVLQGCGGVLVVRVGVLVQ